MADRIDYLFQEWQCLGGAVLLAQMDTIEPTRSPEEIIAESTVHCRDSSRLTWVALDWLIRHIEQIDADELFQETKKSGDLSVLGVLCDAAYLRNPHSKFQQIVRVCAKPDKEELFFHRVARSQLASRLAQENALEVFRRWNYLCSELRYL